MYMYKCTYTCVYVYVYVYTHTHICNTHTHTHTHIHKRHVKSALAREPSSKLRKHLLSRMSKYSITAGSEECVHLSQTFICASLNTYDVI